MNALFRLGVSAFMVLLACGTTVAQQSTDVKLPDSIGKVIKSKYQHLDQSVNANKSKLASLKPSFLSDSLQRSSLVNFSGLAVGTGMQRIGNDYRATYSLEGQMTIFRMPIQLQFSNQQSRNLLNNPLQGNLFKMGFDRQSLLKSMVPELDNYQSLKQNVFGGKEASTVLREQLMTEIKKGGLSQQEKFAGLHTYLNQYGNVEELLKLDDAALREKMGVLLSKQKNNATKKGDSLLKGQEFKDKELLDSLSQRVLSMKQQLDAHGVVPERLSAIENQLNKGSDLKGYISKYQANDLGSKGWQGLLNRLNDVEMGSFGEQLPGSFMNKDLFLQGGSVGLQTRKGVLQLGLAASQDIGFAKDAGFTHSNFNVSKWVTFVSIPVIGNGYAKSRISWTGSLEKQSYHLNAFGGVSPRSGSALTLSQELGSEKMGKFTFELSKSAMAFRNVGQIGSEHLLLERNSFGNYFRDDLFETMAFGVKYDLSDQKSRLNTNLFFNYSGIGFQNPAQQGFGNMGLRMGGAVKKGFLKNKVVLNFRGDLKNTPVSGTTDAHWQNHNLNFEARFRLTKKFNFSVKYMDNGVQKSGEQTQAVYGSKKYQFDVSSSYRLFKKSGFSHLVVGLQDMNNPIAQSSSQFLTSIYTQSLSLGTVTLMGNVFFNKELGQQNLLGDLLNADAAVQYQLLEKISASTGATYLDNTGQARQLGIKQNLQFTAWKNFEVNLYADVRKNMITPLYPELFANNRAEVSLKYYLR